MSTRSRRRKAGAQGETRVYEAVPHGDTHRADPAIVQELVAWAMANPGQWRFKAPTRVPDETGHVTVYTVHPGPPDPAHPLGPFPAPRSPGDLTVEVRGITPEDLADVDAQMAADPAHARRLPGLPPPDARQN